MVCLFFLSSKVLLESAFHQPMENGENQTSRPKHTELKKVYDWQPPEPIRVLLRWGGRGIKATYNFLRDKLVLWHITKKSKFPCDSPHFPTASHLSHVRHMINNSLSVEQTSYLAVKCRGQMSLSNEREQKQFTINQPSLIDSRLSITLSVLLLTSLFNI